MQEDKTQKLLDESERSRLALLSALEDQKKIEEKLHESENLLKESQIIASLGSYILDIPTGLWKSSYVLDKVFGIDEAYQRSVEGWVALTHPDDRKMMVDYFRNEVLGKSRNFDKEYRIVRHDNQAERWVHGLGKLEFNAQGCPLKMHGTIQDITERKKTEEALKKEEAEYRMILDSSPIIVFYKDREGRFLRVNKIFADMLNMSKEKFTGKTVFDLYSADIAREMMNDDQQVLESGKPKLNIIEQYESKQGKRWVQTDKIPTFDVNGKVIGLVGFAQDITERKQVENELIRSERQLSEAQSIARLGSWEWNILANVTEWSSELYNIFGITPKLLVPNAYEGFLNRVHPLDRERVAHVMEQALATKESFSIDYRIVRPDGIERYIHARVRVITDRDGQVVRMQGSSQDITERKHVEEMLRESETEYRLLFESSLDTILLTAPDGRILKANPEACRTFGRTEEELQQLGWAGLVDSTDPRLEAALEERLRTGRFKGELTLVRKDGTKFPAEASTIAFKNINGEEYTSSSIRDITTRKQAEEALRESETKFRAVADTSVAGIFIYQGEKFIYANPATETITGFTSEEFLEKRFWEIVHPDFRETVKYRGLARQHGESVPPRYEFKILTKSSEERWLDFGVGMIHVGGKPAALGVAFDITERKKVENQLNASYQQMRQLTARLHAVKEEESARIAREIHDELGQTLTGIKMDLSFLEEALIENYECEKTNPLIKKLNSMSELADGAIQTVRKIATELRPAILDSMGISAAIEWQAEELEHRTGIKCKYTPTLENLELDREHSTAIFRILQESLTNIVRHAKATKVNITFKEEADGLVLEIQDNGKGISKNDMNKKNSFGLLGMKERAWLLGGNINIQGVQGKGTTIELKIPLKR